MLVKRLPVVILDSDAMPTGHDADLVRLAGCPQARTSGEPAGIPLRVQFDETCCRHRADAAESGVVGLSGASGQQSDRLMAGAVKEGAEILELVG